MTKGTITRTILFVIIIVNMVLKFTGHEIVNIDESVVAEAVECAISVGVLVLTFWKNNSFTKDAQKADEYLAKLKSMEEE